MVKILLVGLALALGGCSKPLSSRAESRPEKSPLAFHPATRCLNSAGSFSLLDIYADGNLNSFLDGNTINAHFEGVDATPFVPAQNNRVDPQAYLALILDQLDVDGNRAVDRYDASLINAYMFGTKEIKHLVGPNATRNEQEILNFIDQLAKQQIDCAI